MHQFQHPRDTIELSTRYREEQMRIAAHHRLARRALSDRPPDRLRRAGSVLLVCLLVGLALVVPLLPVAPASATPANQTPEAGSSGVQQIVPLVQPSVVYTTVTWSGYVYDTYHDRYLPREEPFTVTTQCSGFVVNPDGWVATAGHCVDPALGKEQIRRAAAQWTLSDEAFYYAEPENLTVEDVIGDYRVDTLSQFDRPAPDKIDRRVTVSWGASVSGIDVEKRKPARVVDFQRFSQGDGALLKVEETGLNAIVVGDAEDVEINDGVTGVGYPGVIAAYTDPDLTPTFEPGTVSSLKTVGDGLLSVLQLSADLTGGMSGGPTVDTDGEVVGVISSGFAGESINYAVPADRIQELMAAAGVENQVGEATQTYREGIIAYFDGDRATAVAALAAVVEEQPANGLAAEFLERAEELPSPAPADTPASWKSWMLPTAGGAVLAMAVLAAFVFVPRRRSRRDDPAGDPRDAASVWLSQSPTAAGMVGQPTGPSRPVDSRTPVGAGVGVNGAAPTQPPGREGSAFDAPSRYCTSCGAPSSNAMAFCAQCGTRLGSAE